MKWGDREFDNIAHNIERALLIQGCLENLGMCSDEAIRGLFRVLGSALEVGVGVFYYAGEVAPPDHQGYSLLNIALDTGDDG